MFNFATFKHTVSMVKTWYVRHGHPTFISNFHQFPTSWLEDPHENGLMRIHDHDQWIHPPKLGNLPSIFPRNSGYLMNVPAVLIPNTHSGTWRPWSHLPWGHSMVLARPSSHMPRRPWSWTMIFRNLPCVLP